MGARRTYHQSGLGRFEFCNWAWYLEEIEGKKGIGNFYSCRGNGTHKARKLNLRQKVVSGIDMPLDEMLDAARDEVNRQVKKGYVDLHTVELEGLNKNAAAGRIIDTTLKLVKVDRQQLQSAIQPVEVEIERTIKLKNWPFDLGMTIDSVDADRFITDCKTSRNKWTQEKADSEYQPSIYILGERVHRDNPAGFRYHCLSITAKRHIIYAQCLITQRTDAQIISVLERIAAMDKAIKAGIFTPAHQSSWKCSAQWCPWFRMCKFVQK